MDQSGSEITKKHLQIKTVPTTFEHNFMRVLIMLMLMLMDILEILPLLVAVSTKVEYFMPLSYALTKYLFLTLSKQKVSQSNVQSKFLLSPDRSVPKRGQLICLRHAGRIQKP